MIIVMGFSALAIVSALVAALFNDTRRVVLALWVCGMCVGSIFLSFGAEVLSLVQWIVTTIGCVSLLLFSSMCGELSRESVNRRSSFDLLQATMVGVGVTAVLGVTLMNFNPDPASTPVNGQDLQSFGTLLTEKHLISLNVLGITLLLVLVGAGVLTRSERPE